MNEKQKPSIRFKGFTEDWEQRKLNIITDVRDGTHDSPRYVEDGHPFITSKNVKDGFLNFDEIQYISDKDYEEINKRSKVNSNDILMGMIGTIGNIALVRENPDFAIKNVALIKDTGEVFYLYLYYALQSHIVVNQLGESLDGGTQKFIALNKVRELVIPFPNEYEQQKIGGYLEGLDNLTTLHQRKYDKLVNVKKSMLEKMFPCDGKNVPEIRFSGFTEAWEQSKLGELIDVCSGRDYKHLSEGGIPVYGTGGYMLSVNKALSYDKDAIGIGRKGTIDKPYILNAPFWTVDTLFYAVPRENVDLNFVFDLFQNINWKKKDESTGVPSLSKTAINDIDVLAPKYNEQQVIGQLFSRIDNLITLHQREVKKLQNIKKSCLEKMFI